MVNQGIVGVTHLTFTRNEIFREFHRTVVKYFVTIIKDLPVSPHAHTKRLSEKMTY